MNGKFGLFYGATPGSAISRFLQFGGTADRRKMERQVHRLQSRAIGVSQNFSIDSQSYLKNTWAWLYIYIYPTLKDKMSNNCYMSLGLMLSNFLLFRKIDTLTRFKIMSVAFIFV